MAGEIRRFLRDDGSVKVSRSLKERAAAIKLTRQRLTGTLGREPTLSELAAELDLTVEEIASAETATASAESIQKETGEEGFTLENVLPASRSRTAFWSASHCATSRLRKAEASPSSSCAISTH